MALLSRLRRKQKPPEDGRGRLSQVTHDDRVIGYTYNGQGYLASQVDPLGQTTLYSYEADGLVEQVTLPDSRTVGFRYDANGNLQFIRPPGRPEYEYRPDNRDLLAEYLPPAVTPGGSTRYSYNQDAQLVDIVRPDGQVVHGDYDPLVGRLRSLTVPRGTISLGYHSVTGDLNSVQAPGSSRSFGYQGALLATLTSGGVTQGTVNWSYDNDFRTSSTNLDGGHALAYQYDADSEITDIGPMHFTLNPQNGLVTGATLGAVNDAITYRTTGELTGYSASAGGTALYSEAYVVDKLGRVQGHTETIQGTTTVWDYRYDATGRLDRVTKNGGVVQTLVYDANDNRQTETTPAGTTNYQIDPQQDRLISFTDPQGTTTFQYDANGMLQSKTRSGQTTRYTYDTLGALTRVELPDGRVIEYEVDAANQRAVKKVNGTVVSKWLYDGGLFPLAEQDGNNNLTAVYRGMFMVKGGVVYRVLRDQLGSVRLVVDSATGQVVQRISYDAWGNVTEDTNPGFQPFGFAGGLYDSDTGLLRFGARDYDPQLGRWTAPDPLELAAGTNRYVYSNNQPTSMIDPTGLQSIKTGVKKVGAEVVQEGTEAAIQKGAMKLISKVADNFVGGPAAPLLVAVDVGDALAFLSAPIIEGIYTTAPDPGEVPRRSPELQEQIHEEGQRSRGRQRDVDKSCDTSKSIDKERDRLRRKNRDFRLGKDVPEVEDRVVDSTERGKQRVKTSLKEQTNVYDP